MAVKKIKWSNPQLVDLGGTERVAYGICDGGDAPYDTDCTPGSGPRDLCMSGREATACAAGTDGAQ